MSDSTYTFDKPEGLLAHYTTAAVAFEHILTPSGYLRMGPYRDMHDPLENRRYLPRSLTPMSDEWIDEDEGRSSIFSFTDEVNELRNAARVLSLSTDAPSTEWPDETYGCCWARPRMWEQYADRHRGVCLVFDAEALRSAIEDQLGSGRGKLHIETVDYSEGAAGESGASRVTISSSVADYVNTFYRDFFFSKSNDFRTEYELRAVLLQPQDDGFAEVHYGEALVAVVLGHRFPHWQVPGASQRCDPRDAELRRIGWDQGRARLWPPDTTFKSQLSWP